MKKILILILCCISAIFVSANDGAFYAEGNQLIPINETDISVQKEVLTLNRVGDHIEVTVYYEFFNPADQKELLVGFEAQKGDAADPRPTFPEHPSIHSFKVSMNGEPLSFEVAHIDGIHYDYDEDENIPTYVNNGHIEGLTREYCEAELAELECIEPIFDYVYHFNATFRPGLNIIQHTYDFDMSVERNGFTSDFFYVLTAANRWANHQIDDFTLYIDMGDHTSFHISPSFFKSPDEWEILGIGKNTVGTTPYQVKPDSIFFHMQQGSIRFHKENFHPDGELYITQDQIWGSWWWILNPDNRSFNSESYLNYYKDQYEPIVFYSDIENKETYYDLFSPEQRRILKNLPFAYRGYVFTNKALQDFFESTYWYIPNRDYKAEMETLDEMEQNWVEFWN